MTLGNLEKLHSCYAIIYISPKTAALTHHLKQDFLAKSETGKAGILSVSDSAK
jgi:hypothetical protein